MRLRSTSYVLISGLVVFGCISMTAGGCSSGSDRPDAGALGENNTDDASARETSINDETGTGAEAGGDGAAPPKSCSNTIRDGLETDVDCGGTECPRCIDGKDCVKDTDCAGISCSNKVCITANCKDGITNGDETDVDCGGPVCAKCTIGKRCTAATDCASTTCGLLDNACACPPSMAVVSKATGGAYCVDQVEITKGQYNKFINANVPIGDQKGACSANTTFVPRGAWPPAATPSAGGVGNLAFSMGLPVHYVDWCDAAAYCKWSNKQLCGKINGGTLAQSDANNVTESAWFNACTAQGVNGWPYGTSYLSSKCNGTGAGVPGIFAEGVRDGYGFPENQDQGVYDTVVSDANGNISQIATHHSGCQGGSVNLHQMSGNVAEWEDSCDGTAAAANCNLRGGSYKASGVDTTLRCNATRVEARLPADSAVLADVGFRCCLY